MLDIPIPAPSSKKTVNKIFEGLDKIPKNPKIPIPQIKKVTKPKISKKAIKQAIIKKHLVKKHIIKKLFGKEAKQIIKEVQKHKTMTKHVHEAHHKKPFHHKIKAIFSQNRHRAKSLEHLKVAKIYLQRKDLDKAKKNYSKALIHYFKMPNHEEPIHLQLRSTLKEIENQELQPHYEFHESSRNIIKLKKQNKEVSHESLDAFKQFNKALQQSSKLSIPKIQEKPEYVKPTQMPIIQPSKQLMPRVEKQYKKVKLSPIQKQILKKIQLLEKEKEKINAKLNEVSQ